MYEKSDERRLYWLIDQYLLGKIDELTFCDEFYYSYDLEINNETLSDTHCLILVLSVFFSLKSLDISIRSELRSKTLTGNNMIF